MAGLAGSIFIMFRPHGTQVNIVQEGTVLYTFDLSVTKNQTIDIKYEGRVNIVQIENGKIRVLEAECQDKTCVHRGWLKDSNLPIVCLPNHLVIEYTDVNDNVDAFVK